MTKPKIEDYALNGFLPVQVYDPENDFYVLGGKVVDKWEYNQVPKGGGRYVVWNDDIGEEGIEEASKPRD